MSTLSVQAFWKGGGETFESREVNKIIHINDDGLLLSTTTKTAKTVALFLAEQKISLGAEDKILPAPDTPLYSSMTLHIKRARHIILNTADEERSATTYLTDVDAFLSEQGIILGEHDFVLPDENQPLSDGDTMKIVRVEVSEEHLDKAIAFEKQVTEDSEMSWRKTIVTQKGENGIKRSMYRITRHDGKEIARKLLKTEVTKEPVAEIITQGTLVKVGKKHHGLGTWYAHTGTLSAASPWLPMGSHVRVTNPENGKTVIVKINDRGPFGKGRILDLDKVAFERIASIGQGVITVKVEEITN